MSNLLSQKYQIHKSPKMASIKTGKYLTACEGSMSVTLGLRTVSVTELQIRRCAETIHFVKHTGLILSAI